MSTFEAAEAALDQHLSQPAQAEPSRQSSENSSSSESAPSASNPDSGQSISEILELDKLEKFKFDGREWTPRELRNAQMMQSDYSKKTEALAQERRYYENLDADLKLVRSNPELASKFKEIYPQNFHQYLSHVLPQVSQQQNQAASQNSQVPQEVLTQLKELRDFKTQFETKNLEAEIDSAFSKLTDKYPMADEQNVTAKANFAVQQGIQLRGEDGKLNVGELEKIFKAEHERTQKAFDTHYKQLTEKQKQASAKARDVAGGGGVPGQAPEKLSFEQATQRAIQELGAR